MSISSSIAEQYQQLANHPYAVEAGDFVRFRADPTDEVVAGVVRSVSAQGARACHDFRKSLSESDSDTIRLFAMRRTLQARRLASSSAAYEALDGFALLARTRDVPWESWLKGALFVARANTGDLAMIGRRYDDVASENAKARFHVALNAMDRLHDLKQCYLIEVSTNHGVGFIEIMVFRGIRNIGFTSMSAPSSLGNNEVDFDPTTNVAQLAVTFADSLDNTSSFVTGPIGQDQLVAAMFSLAVSGSYLPSAGCLSFTVDPLGEGPSFTAYVVEVLDEDDPATLAEAAQSIDGQAALFDANRLIVLSPQPNFEDEDEVTVDFSGVEELAYAALVGPTPPARLAR